MLCSFLLGRRYRTRSSVSIRPEAYLSWTYIPADVRLYILFPPIAEALINVGKGRPELVISAQLSPAFVDLKIPEKPAMP